jgi:WD40 repeat protein
MGMKNFLTTLLILSFNLGLYSQIQLEKSLHIQQKIYCFAYSDDGKYIASAGDNKNITIFQTSDYNPIASFGKIKDIPLAISFSHDGTKLAIGGKDNQVTIYNLSNQQIIYTLKAHKEQVMALTFSPDDKFIASASLDKMIHIWDLNSGELATTLSGNKKSLTSIDYSLDGSKLISGCADGTLKIWNLKNSQIELDIPAHKNWIRKVLYSPDGSIIATCGDDKKINLWDAISGAHLNTFLGHKNWIINMDFSPDGNYLLSGGHDLVFIVTDLRTGQMVYQSEKYSNYILCLAFNPDGQSFASSSLFSDELKIWNAQYLEIKPVEKHLAVKSASKSGLAPKISLLSPQNKMATSQPSIKVEAQIFSESSLRSIKLIVNGAIFVSKDRAELMLASIEKGYLAFNENVVLSEGDNKILIQASNMVGETSSDPLTVSFSSAPVVLLSWISPSLPTTETNEPIYEIKANVDAAGSSQQVSVWINGINHGSMEIPASGGLFSKEVRLEPGKNSIALKVKTPAYEKTCDTRNIQYTPAQKPLITFLNPASDTLINISGVQVKAKINSLIPIEQLIIKVNDLPVYTKNQVNINQFTIDQLLQLSNGINKIQIIAKNKAGESKSPMRIINYQAPQKTNISWISPGSNAEIFEPTINLQACIQSKSNISKIELLNNDGLMLSETNFNLNPNSECTIDFVKNISIAPGVNNLKIKAINAAGVTQSEVRTITYTIPQSATIQWIEPRNFQLSTGQNTLDINTCINANTAIESISLMLNGLVIATQENPPKSNDDCSYLYLQTVPLSKGNNIILIKVKTIAGEAISSPVLVDYKSSNPYRFALIIGNEDYSSYQSGLNSESNVDFALNDAREFKAMCEKALGIKNENIIYLENARYTDMMKNIKKLSGIIEVTKGKAEVFVFYAGHGFPDEKTKEPYLVPVDGSGSDIDITGVKLTYFYEQLTAAPAQRITVFLDACFSGGARNQGLIAARGVKIVPKETEKAVKKKLVVFSASTGDQSSLPYAEKKHGMFSYYLLQKLNETHGNVTYKELSEYVSEQVSIKSFMINSKQQEPQTNVSPEVQNEWQKWKFSE